MWSAAADEYTGQVVATSDNWCIEVCWCVRVGEWGLVVLFVCVKECICVCVFGYFFV